MFKKALLIIGTDLKLSKNGCSRKERKYLMKLFQLSQNQKESVANNLKELFGLCIPYTVVHFTLILVASQGLEDSFKADSS